MINLQEIVQQKKLNQSMEKMMQIMKAKSKQDEVIMDVEELADYLKVKKSWVYKKVQFKEIPFSHVGKYPRFRKKDIDAWFEEKSSCRARA